MNNFVKGECSEPLVVEVDEVAAVVIELLGAVDLVVAGGAPLLLLLGVQVTQQTATTPTLPEI